MNRELILITGASGCVGQYVCAWLLENSEADLLLWLRDPTKLTAISKNNSRVRLIVGDLREADSFNEELSKVTRVIHTATAWGDPERARQVNVVAVKEILRLLNPNLLEQFIYFSTASILNRELQPLPEALLYGTEYIQTKAQCLRELEVHPLAERIIAVFPTLVFGGRIDGKSSFPSSYLTEGLIEASKWLWLARLLRTESSFHFIHAADIAFVCGHLATTPHLKNPEANQGALRRIVLGQPAITINQAIKALCIWRGLWWTPGLPLWGWLIEVLIKVLPIKINDWDRFSIKQKHFTHNPISPPERFGGKSKAKDLEAVLNQSGLQKRLK
ncbi:NAD(P)-dependent oxidoreductase [Prochlorococcus sp. MIT 1341]|uniref:NAD-dependent epimerase/dehydratase family protein n=1 Tax=Prochlorococcus sp. MIT 1341 TaxID=3096221 RepID=UPI002A75004A|nr:NAD(P)-dependent oxidoreductase [Prochlorococcus sp. MIT 1341]